MGFRKAYSTRNLSCPLARRVRTTWGYTFRPMPNIDKHALGAFCWFELATTDQAGAKKFYQSLFGWSAEDSPMGPNDYYTMFRVGGRDAAAVCTIRPEQRAAGVPSNWMIYIAVANAEATAKLAGELGATVVAPPFDVMDFGRMAVIKDPTGAMFSIWQPMSHVGTRVVEEHGTVVWADLSGADQARAGEFYSKLFGWKMLSSKEGPAAKPGDYYHIANGEAFIGG